ncbi:MarR family winged helix-turn-helix transcriptional regulator [Hoyosella sp. YIM 151337]|uniref:MarR family winged helix-turn-helix transcriptional regulator n=1 Tax=Hoyosella sp. YIM 151337 TaxID=2992742 RepID=UPI00223657C7|nr:MarR family winged helix-turn-helix transcriptional regulator [Hoyosella sp. YIM 151337]MCW4354444.1 MarR family winged helix-turn-helix transcriptional regulator [Hoyosella sp. YIM 151337]
MAQVLVPAEIADHTTCLLSRLGQAMYRLTEDVFAPFALRTRHYTVLTLLAASGPTGQHALSAALRIDPATMVSVIDDLEALSCAERHRDILDRRRILVAITDKGQDTLTQMDAALTEMNDHLLADLDSAQRDTLHQLLRTLSDGPTVPAALDRARS